MRALFYTITLLSFATAQANAASFEISDSVISKLAGKENPSVEQLEANLLKAKISQSKVSDRFSSNIKVSGGVAGTNEQGLTQFVPVFTPTKSAEISYNKRFRFGTNLSAGFSASQVTATMLGLNNATTDQFFVNLEFDLWKDVFGRSSYAEDRANEEATKRAELEKKVNSHVFKNNARRVYWNLVANEESRKINQILIKNAESQLKNAKRRARNSIADKGEVARYEAQLATREASLTYLDYQRENYLKQLRDLLPSLRGKEIALSSYDLSKTTTEVLACTATIASKSEVPLDHSLYDEMVETYRSESKNRRVKLNRYDDVDVKLTTSLTTTGVDSTNPGTIGRAYRDLADNDRWGGSVALAVTIPLGPSDTEELQLAEESRQTRASADQLEVRIKTTHTQLLQSIKLLSKATELQIKSTAALKVRLDEIEKKYRQARASVTELVLDQDAYFDSSLAVIDTQLQLLNTLFDYLSVFSETPCQFNQV